MKGLHMTTDEKVYKLLALLTEELDNLVDEKDELSTALLAAETRCEQLEDKIAELMGAKQVYK
jgi:hypothetical protein